MYLDWAQYDWQPCPSPSVFVAVDISVSAATGRVVHASPNVRVHRSTAHSATKITGVKELECSVEAELRCRTVTGRKRDGSVISAPVFVGARDERLNAALDAAVARLP